MTDLDPNWTPEEAYRILREAVDACIAGDVSATGLHHWLNGTYAVPVGTSGEHRAVELARQLVVNVAVYLQCDLDRTVLVESLRELVQGFDRGAFVAFTPITRSPCFFAMMRNQQIPAPLINLTAQNIRLEWEREGFREI